MAERHMSNWPAEWEEYGGSDVLMYGWAGIFRGRTNNWAEIVDWLYDNVSNTKQNAHWVYLGGAYSINLRRPKDYTMFALRWS